MTLEHGRRAFANREWKEAYRQLSAADADSPVEPADLERLAQAAYLIGRDADAKALFRRAYHVLVDQGQPERAARWGFWLSFDALLIGDVAQGTGWLARIQRLAGERTERVEHGYAGMLSGLRQMVRGNAEGARADFERVISLADRFQDHDLLTFGLLGRGQALIQLQRVAEGVSQLDEAMIAVAAGEVSPMAAGIVYCAAILTFQRIFDVQRCREWTQALSEWCAAQPDLVPYRAECLVHRSEILRLQGEWAEAMSEAKRAIDICATRAGGSTGRAFYQHAELHRLRGEFELAEEAYREAGRRGIEPQPGLSLLRLAQGDVDAAKAAIRRVVNEAGDRQGPGGAATARPEVLRAYVEVAVVAGEIDAAMAAASELETFAAGTDAQILRASSSEATGCVLLAQGNAQAALPILRQAWSYWQQLEAPYEEARVRVLIGRACQGVGDEETARSHYDAAACTFDRLGAAPALAELERPEQAHSPASGNRLSRRELEVLREVAKGLSNREIAARLFISEHTVAGHLSSIFNKLGVSSRTAAAAFAFERGLL